MKDLNHRVHEFIIKHIPKTSDLTCHCQGLLSKQANFHVQTFGTSEGRYLLAINSFELSHFIQK